MSIQLKERIIVADPDGHFEMWTRQEYDEYVRGAVSVGAGAAYGIVTHFNEDERLLAPAPPDNDMPTAFQNEPVNFLLSNALRHLTQDQQRQLCNALQERLPRPTSAQSEAEELYPLPGGAAGLDPDYTLSDIRVLQQSAYLACASRYQSEIQRMGELLMSKDGEIEGLKAEHIKTTEQFVTALKILKTMLTKENLNIGAETAEWLQKKCEEFLNEQTAIKHNL